VVGDEPRQRFGDLRDVGAGEQHSSGHVVPPPGGRLGHEPGDQGDDRAPERDAQRNAGVLAGLRAEPAQELFGMLAVQVCQAGHLGMRLGHPGYQPPERVAGVAHGLWPVEVGLQVQPQVALEHGTDLRRREIRCEMVDPRAGVDPAGRRLLDLADVEQQHVYRVQPGDRRVQVPVGHLGWWPRIRCSGVELAQRIEPQPGSEPVDRLPEFDQIIHAEHGQVRVAAMQQHASERPGQLRGSTGVAQLLQPGQVPVEQGEVDTEAAIAHLVLERAGKRAREQHRIVQADALDQRQIGQVRHDHARAAVRVLPADAVLLVQQPLPQRRVEPVL